MSGNEEKLEFLLEERANLEQKIKERILVDYKYETALRFLRYCTGENNNYGWIGVLGAISEEDMAVVLTMNKGFTSAGAWASPNNDLFASIEEYLQSKGYILGIGVFYNLPRKIINVC